jgi:hypothetical protein
MDAFDLFFNKKLIKYEFSKNFTLKNSLQENVAFATRNLLQNELVVNLN